MLALAFFGALLLTGLASLPRALRTRPAQSRREEALSGLWLAGIAGLVLPTL